MFPRPFARPIKPSGSGDAQSYEFPGDQAAAVPPAPTDILLQFIAGADAAQISAALQAVGGTLAEVVRAADGEAGPLLRVELPEGQALQDAVELLASQPGVAFA